MSNRRCPFCGKENESVIEQLVEHIANDCTADFYYDRPIEDELRAENEQLKNRVGELTRILKLKLSDRALAWAYSRYLRHDGVDNSSQLQAKLVDAKDALINIRISTGNPDAKDACRIITALTRQAIKDIDKE